MGARDGERSLQQLLQAATVLSLAPDLTVAARLYAGHAVGAACCLESTDGASPAGFGIMVWTARERCARLRKMQLAAAVNHLHDVHLPTGCCRYDMASRRAA